MNEHIIQYRADPLLKKLPGSPQLFVPVCSCGWLREFGVAKDLAVDYAKKHLQDLDKQTEV